MNNVQVYDGGLLIHSILSQINIGSSYANIARTMLSMVCSGNSQEVHVCFDKYLETSIKNSERKLRGAIDCPYVITGPDQKIRQSAQTLLTNGIFKNELAKFLLKEWHKSHYLHILNGKQLFASHGGECFQYEQNETFEGICVTIPEYLQGDHEEADTLIAFHIANLTSNNVMVRASDTDIIVILIGLLGQQLFELQPMSNIIMDYGMGNTRRYINVTSIASKLETKITGLPLALPGFFIFTGCDFTLAFYR